jgi:hypothetical protein
MKKMNAGVGIVLTATVALLSAGLGVYCLPWGINDQQSSAGFFILSLFFFITSLSKAMTIQFGEDQAGSANLVDFFFRGVNKWIASGLLIAYSVPHPQFTGILLWSGIAGVLFYSGLMNVLHVLFTLHGMMGEFMSARRVAKTQLRAQKAMAQLLHMQEAEIKKNAKVEEDLVADLNNFFAESDPTDNSKK